ncbi:metal-dependent hydrolase [Parasphingorhabdus cellanae]|uniref:metal-dependent hydrolase n=1 Tax=Parasphingorhabdus cellanae TaxID=2806553 RepID=UPI0021752BC3|nr:metal-dependent hydrolase [Parasphingorhabdus cellanae]
MVDITPTPADLKINPRNLRFHQDGGMPDRWWLNGDPVATAFFNALSCTFPKGEKFFMDSVRHYRGAVGPELQQQIAAFIAQEAVHSREHVTFNKLASDHGYPVDILEARTGHVLRAVRQRSPVRQLAATCALEHFTAILAHQFLKSGASDLAGAPKETVKLWSWHAMEEIEHKSVTFDTFLSVTKHMSRPDATRCGYWQ